jgi:hypothetical protein
MADVLEFDALEAGEPVLIEQPEDVKGVMPPPGIVLVAKTPFAAVV